MKKQQCILKCIKNGICTDFERFACKKPQTIINEYKKAADRLSDYFFKEYHEADIIQIIATPDGYHEGAILAAYTPQEFFTAIS